MTFGATPVVAEDRDILDVVRFNAVEKLFDCWRIALKRELV
jgi:hypothetical protein